MSELVKITDYADRSEKALPSQYQGKPKLIGLLRAEAGRYQEIEDAAFDIASHGGIDSGHDSLLDQIGDIINQPRNGLTDAQYRIFLYSKVTFNTSKATPEVLIKLYKVLMSAEKVYYNPIYPASFALTAIGPSPAGTVPDVPFSFSDDPDPDGQGFGDYNNVATGGDFASASGFSAAMISAIKQALNAARLGGVSIDYIATVESRSFSFSDDPDLEGLGFGDDGDSSVGGVLAEII